MSLHDELLRAGLIRPLDHALARSLQRLRPETPDTVPAAAALASLAVAQGHAGFDPAAPSPLPAGRGEAEPPSLPSPEAWLADLRASPWVAAPDSGTDQAAPDAPLVLEGGLLYLRRYREYERRLALGLRRIAAAPLPAPDLAALAPTFAVLFPQAAAGEDRQARAAALALRRALLLVTGGPGTGKTTTIARLLVLRLAQAAAAGQPAPRIALAAPTGRAAERMAESLRRASARMAEAGIAPALLAALPAGASTLHRLLGTVPDSPRFRHHADNPLPFDVVVVDEASMVDLPLMAKLVDAVADGTGLILLGDADQLPSVEAGDVLAAILAAAGPGDALAADDAAALAPLIGNAPVLPALAGIGGHRVDLVQGWRQAEGFDLAPLADAVRAGDADTVLALLRGGTLAGVHFHENAAGPFQHRRDALLAHWRALAEATDPAEALQRAGTLRLLTAVREGPQGARGLNARIEELLSGRRTGPTPAWFHGRLLLITQNSYRHRLFNGDIGICLRSEASPFSGRSEASPFSGRSEASAPAAQDDSATLMAWFPGDAPGEVRAFHPATLPAHDSAFAMTVHKAQGSEFDEVWLQLPRNDSRVLSRELIYTAITRARTRLHIAGSAQVLRDALARHAERMSGLAWRLGGQEVLLESSRAHSEATPLQGDLF